MGQLGPCASHSQAPPAGARVPGIAKGDSDSPEIAGRPARLTLTVMTSPLYMASGSAVFSPDLYATVGALGMSRASNVPRDDSLSLCTRVRTCWARL